MKDIKDGWAFDPTSGSIYKFEHFPLSRANELSDQREVFHIVETINFTYAENDKTVHRNKYFTLDFPSAIALAARMEIEWQEVAEEVVSIRSATDQEIQIYLDVSDYFDGQMPEAISDEQASQLSASEEQGPFH